VGVHATTWAATPLLRARAFAGGPAALVPVLSYAPGVLAHAAAGAPCVLSAAVCVSAGGGGGCVPGGAGGEVEWARAARARARALAAAAAAAVSAPAFLSAAAAAGSAGAGGGALGEALATEFPPAALRLLRAPPTEGGDHWALAAAADAWRSALEGAGARARAAPALLAHLHAAAPLLPARLALTPAEAEAAHAALSVHLRPRFGGETAGLLHAGGSLGRAELLVDALRPSEYAEGLGCEEEGDGVVVFPPARVASARALLRFAAAALAAGAGEALLGAAPPRRRRRAAAPPRGAVRAAPPRRRVPLRGAARG
jgi:hypothetical protein